MAPEPQPSMSHQGSSSMLSKVVPIKIYREDHSFIETFAFLDDGSHLSFMDRELYEALGRPTGYAEKLWLKWTGGIKREEDSIRTKVRVSGTKGKKRFSLSNIFVVASLDLPAQSMDAEDLKKSFKHLKSLPLVDLHQAKPKVLIGLQHAQLLNGDRKFEGAEGEPIATKTKLGWTVYGNSRGPLEFISLHSHQVSTARLDTEEISRADDELHQLVKGYFASENFGVIPSPKALISAEIQRANDIMNKTLKMVDGRYEIGLLWKSDEVQLPDSFAMASKRLISQERSLKKNPTLLAWKNDHIKGMIQKGHARKATSADLNHSWPRVWYTPTFVIVNQNKIPPKPRDVADVAAKVKGESLNTNLLKGPDNLIPLMAALFKVRQSAVAVTADVQEMFHQVTIIEEDQQCQRFLWRDGDESKDPTVYIMQRMMFGPTCSPSCAQFVKNTHEAQFQARYPEAVKGLIETTYVDDYFNSHETTEQALKTCLQAIEICATMSFNLTGFQSNCRGLLRNLPQDKLKTTLVDFDASELESLVTKLLGMCWDPLADTFTFKLRLDDLLVKMLEGNYVPTKREVLKTLMRIFDPLGFIAHYLIRGRILLQGIWREGTEWDQPISSTSHRNWLEFILQLRNIEKIKIPRQYGSLEPSKSQVELVVFVDASEEAYAATAFFCISQSELVEIVHVMAKARVAPTKRQTIPQLELNAAVLGTRLAITINELHEFKIHRTTFLSDSRIVLLWINSEKFKFKPFVASRVGEIFDTTTKAQWFHIGSQDNIADDATKWQDPTMGDNEARWFKGSRFV